MAKAAEVFDVSLRVIECCVKRGKRGVPEDNIGEKEELLAVRAAPAAVAGRGNILA